MKNPRNTLFKILIGVLLLLVISQLAIEPDKGISLISSQPRDFISSQNGQNESQTDIGSSVEQNAAGEHAKSTDGQSSFARLMSQQTNQSEGRFTLIQGELKTDNTTYTALGNNSSVPMTPFSNSTISYSKFNASFDLLPYLGDSNYVFEDQFDTQSDLNGFVVAQAAIISDMAPGGSTESIVISSFNVTALPPGSSSDISTMVGEVWNASVDINGSVFPHRSLGKATYITSNSTQNDNIYVEKFQFVLSNPVRIDSTSTYTNASGSYVFFVIYANNSGSTTTSWSLKYKITSSSTDKGPTFRPTESSGANIQENNPTYWKAQSLIDFMLEYSASKILRPAEIGMNVLVQSEGEPGYNITSGNKFVDNTTRTSETYYFRFNATKVPDAKLNITVKWFSLNDSLHPATFVVDTNRSIVRWNITFTSSFTPSSSSVKRFLNINPSFTIVDLFRNGTKLTNSVDYVVGRGFGSNKSILFFTGNGSYSVNATSPNMLWNASVATFKYDPTSGWLTASNGTMGTLFPNAKEGDYVKANITNISSLGLVGGVINASLRDPSGIILGNQSIPQVYTDKWLSTEKFVFSENVTFSTYLDPNQTTGIWTFEFYWYNVSAVGAIAVNFSIFPKTSTQLISPSVTTEILENNIVTVEVATIDQSRNATWAGVNPGAVAWALDNKSLTYSYSNGTHYFYRVQFNLSVSNYPTLKTQAYSFKVYFKDGIYEDSLNFTVTVYFRGDTLIEGLSPIYYYETLTFMFGAINVTGGNVLINSSSIDLNINASYSAQYNSSTAKFKITVPWSQSFKAGVNYLHVQWQYGAFRNSLTQVNVSINFAFTVWNRPVIIEESNPSFNESVLDYQEDYSILVTFKDGLNGSVIKIGSFTRNSQSNDSSNNIQVTFNLLPNGSYSFDLTVNSFVNQTIAIIWTLNAEGYDIVNYKLILFTSPRPIDQIVASPTSELIVGETPSPSFVSFKDNITGLQVYIPEDNTTIHYYVYSDLALFNGSDSWYWETIPGGIGLYIYIIPAENDAGKIITLKLPVQIDGYDLVILEVSVKVAPLISTSLNYVTVGSLHYFEEGQVLLNYADENGTLPAFDVSIVAINASDAFKLVSISQLPNDSRIVEFRVMEKLPNNILILNISTSSPGYETRSILIQITMIRGDVELLYSDIGPVPVYNETANIVIETFAYGQPVNAVVIVENYNGTKPPLITPANMSSQFTLIIYLDNKDANTTLAIRLVINTETLYGEQTIYVSVLPLAKINIDVEISGTLAPGQNFTVLITASAEEATQLLALNQASNNIDFSKINVSIFAAFTLADGSTVLQSENITLSTDGIAVAGPFTVPLNAMNASLSITAKGLGIAPVEISSSVSISSPTGPTTLGPGNQNGIPTIYVLAGIATVIGLAALLFIIRLVRKKKEQQREEETRALRLIGEVSNARALIIVDRRTGYAVFTHKFQDVPVDPQLIAGILHAYGAFDQEITGGMAIDVPPGFYRVELGNHFINRVVGDPYDIYLITSGPTDSLKEGLLEFADWFTKKFKTDEPVTDLEFYDSESHEIEYMINKTLHGWITEEIITTNKPQRKLRPLEKEILKWVDEEESGEFTQIIEEFSHTATVPEIFNAVKKLFEEGYLMVMKSDDMNNDETFSI